MGNRLFCSSSMCPKASLNPGAENELFDDSNSCDPAGAIFKETLEDLNEVDRLLLQFSSSTNLAGVRWLFILGANADACDTNGTTCLHVACRGGSLQIVLEFINRDLPLDATDVAGWTALHVALFMGRRNVAILLMQHGAELSVRTNRGQLPAELCSDIWLREALTQCATHRLQHGPDAVWQPDRGAPLLGDIQISSRLRFEPFFVPRTSVLKDVAHCSDVQRLGLEIFNQRPGQGLAFAVAAGCVRDFPVELSGFLSDNSAGPAQVGEFLGEDFALSQTLRLEYINSVRLTGTGVVSCLARVFKLFTIPADMQKLDRLVDGIAQIWWRQHEQLNGKDAESQSWRNFEDSCEVEGVELMKGLGSYDSLYQLMFSTMLLHWNLYSPLPQSQRVTPKQWLQLNAGGEEADAAVLTTVRHVQSLVYNMISHAFYPQLEIWKTQRGGTADHKLSTASTRFAEAPPLKPDAAGWVRLVGGWFHSLALVGAVPTGTVTYRHLRSILSETTATTSMSMVSPMPSRNYSRQESDDGFNENRGSTGAMRLPVSVAYRHQACPPSQTEVPPSGRALSTLGALKEEAPAKEAPERLHTPAMSAGSGTCSPDRAWLALHHTLLFLAPNSKPWAPYAFLDVSGLVLQTDPGALLLTLLPAPSGGLKAVPETGRAGKADAANGKPEGSRVMSASNT
ncbi:unnamed protein product, partial [Polarella glacialis]